MVDSIDNDPGTNFAPPPSTNEEGENRIDSSKGSNGLLSDLHGAILNGSVAHVKTLVEIGTDILESQNGQSALSLALCPPNGNPSKEICELLLRELVNRKGWLWLEEHLNVLYKQKDLQALAKALGCQTYTNGRRCTLVELSKAILGTLGSPNSNIVVGSPSTTSSMATEQVNNALQGEGITTALHSAAETSDDQTISALSVKGDFTAMDGRGRTPLLIALNKGNVKTVLLIFNSMVTQKGRDEVEKMLCLPPYQRKDLQKLCRLLRISTYAGSKQAQSEELASSTVAAILDRAALAQLADAATATHITGDEGGTTNLVLGPGLQPARAPPGEQFWPRPESQKDPQLQHEGGGVFKPLGWGGGVCAYSQVNADGMPNPISAAAAPPVPVGIEESSVSGASVAAGSIALPPTHDIPDDSIQWRGLKGADLTLRMALIKGDTASIQPALDAGADPRVPSHDGRTAFHAAPSPYALKALLIALIDEVGREEATLHFSEGNARYRQFHLQNFARMMGRRFRVVGRGRRLTGPELVDTILDAAQGKIEKDYPAKLPPQDKSGAAAASADGEVLVDTESPLLPAVVAVERSNAVAGVKKASTKAALGAVHEPPSKRFHV